MGFSSSQLVVLKKCSRSILYKLSSNDDNRQERRRLSIKKEEKCGEMNAAPDLANQCKKDQPQPTQSSHVSTEQHQKLQDINACAAAAETNTCCTMQIKNTYSHRLSRLDPQASRSVPDIQINRSSSHGDLPPLNIMQSKQQPSKKPTSTSTPVTPIQSTFNDNNDRFNLTYSKSSASNNSSSSCSEEEEAITPSTCASGPWLSADEMKYDKNAMITRRSKSQGNRTMMMMMMMMMEAKPIPCSSSSSFFPITNNRGSTSTKTTTTTAKKANQDRSHSQSSSSSSSLDMKSIFGKSEFRKKESKAIRMWHTTVEQLMTQRKMTIALEQQRQQPDKATKCLTEKDLAVARFIISELYYTEKSYYQFLMFIRSNYMEPMQTASRSRVPLVKPADVHVLFYHLPDLISLSEKLLGKLEIYANDVGGSPGTAIGQIFKDMEDDFAVFLKYAIHYQGHMKAIRRASNTGYAIKIDHESKTCRKENNRLGLADYLIAPFQRVPRYELLLKDLLKHTHIPRQDSSNAHDLVVAKSIISGLAAAMNMVQEKISKSLFSPSFYLFSTQSTSNLLTVDQPAS
ncbi:uncharacterized protein ATC70_012807 [Mucor velutinosus]|uniref:DH domain-containing protein n=1 Tax=Mucor velutinosus TaxID=708070 RepID=A0AAN7D600_9FUNG|nr:hypothetical protein ATC70_012807 [Mucor velutinosus]